jgi:hypothetical protein
MFVFMMHPNHKVHTRLQLIKRLLNTSNCELIMKCLLSESKPDSPPGQLPASNASPNASSAHLHSFAATVPFNAKLAFYLNALNLNDKEATSNSDKEILIHLDELASQAGLDYKSELARTLAAFARPSSSSVSGSSGMTGSFYFHDVESQWQLLLPESSMATAATHIDLTNQCDKEFDEEILKVYHRNNQVAFFG